MIIIKVPCNNRNICLFIINKQKTTALCQIHCASVCDCIVSCSSCFLLCKFLCRLIGSILYFTSKPNSRSPPPFDSDLESSLLFFRKLSLGIRVSPTLPSTIGPSTTRLQESSIPATTPLFSPSIWADLILSEGIGDSSGNQQSLPSNRYMKGYAENYHLETVMGNFCSGVPSMSIWGNQENPFGLTSILEGGRGLNLNRGIGIANLNASVGPGIYGKNALLALPDYDIILLGKTEGGSLSLQKMLSGKDSTIAYKIFEAVYKYPFDLMTDGYGCHLFAKVIQSCSMNQLGRITLKITSQSELFYKASVYKYGARSMQKMIKVLVGSPCISLVISAVYRRFKDMMFNREASSVIIKCLETLDEQQNEVLYLAAMNHFRELATHVRGCVNLNNFINEMRGPRRGQLLDLITSHAVFLSKDPSGIYVVQHVLGLGDLKYSEKICSLLQGKFEELSLLRCGSHLVEKCLNSPGMAHYVVDDLLKISDHRFLHLARHKYGNFVIQRALRVTKNGNISHHKYLLEKLLNDDALQVGFGRNVYNLIAKGISDD